MEDGEFCPLDKKEHPVLQGALLPLMLTISAHILFTDIFTCHTNNH